MTQDMSPGPSDMPSDLPDVAADAGDEVDMAENMRDMSPPEDMPDALGDCDEVAAPFGGGTGTEEDPFLVCTRAHFASMDDASAGAGTHIEILTDLDLSDAPFDPMDTINASVHGGGHTISNLTHSGMLVRNAHPGLAFAFKGEVFEDLTFDTLSVMGTRDISGVFAEFEGRLEDLELIDVTITGTDPAPTPTIDMAGVGLRSGMDSRVKNIVFEGSLSHTGAIPVGQRRISAGGLFKDFNGVATDLSAQITMNLKRGVRVGGLIGNLNGTLSRSDASGTLTVTPDFAVGGPVGQFGGDGFIEDSFFDGTLDVRDDPMVTVDRTGVLVGGLVGVAAGSAAFRDRPARRPTVRRCFATANILTDQEAPGALSVYVGGLVGALNGGRLFDSYFEGRFTYRVRAAGLIGRYQALSQAEGPFDNIDFVWASFTSMRPADAGTDPESFAILGIAGSSITSLDSMATLVWNSASAEFSGAPSTDNTQALTEAEMKDPANFTTWDTNVWDITAGDFPRLKPPAP